MKVRNCISVVWHMKGMSLDVDYKFGGYVSRLVSMLTAITGRENVNFDITTWAADKLVVVFTKHFMFCLHLFKFFSLLYILNVFQYYSRVEINSTSIDIVVKKSFSTKSYILLLKI